MTWLAAALANPFARTFSALCTAFVLGAVIGIERQLRQRSAGLRTNVLVTLGGAAFSDIGFRLLGAEGATRIVAYVVSGIGFLGAGVILKDGANIRGLNTAATLWCSAAVGTFAGTGFPIEAVELTCLILACNTLLRPLVDNLNRRPFDRRLTEAQYQVHAVCAQRDISDVRDLLFEVLEAANYPVREIRVLSVTETTIELAAVLVPTSADPKELDLAVERLEQSAKIVSSTWTAETAG